ncbi:MAG: 50S ribosomal protein L1 [Armatimonadota bacterium]|jgi:large subunit ribosomal protein L1|nr:MAG: 50S ribosomal protein L1 [Armatimonadota bacterium]
MPKRSERYVNALKAAGVPATEPLEPREALEAVKKAASAKFDETVDVSVNLGVDPRHGDQMVRGTASLPAGTGKKRKVIVFAKGDAAKAAEEAGADYVGAEDLVERIQGGWRDFDVAVATPDVMGMVTRLGRLLGPRMPNQKAGTVTMDVAKVVNDIKKATRVEYRVDKAGIIHTAIGKVSFPTEDLLANFAALINALLKAKPSAAKGKYLKKITVSSTMGPGFQVDTQRAQSLAERGV